MRAGRVPSRRCSVRVNETKTQDEGAHLGQLSPMLNKGDGRAQPRMKSPWAIWWETYKCLLFTEWAFASPTQHTVVAVCSQVHEPTRTRNNARANPSRDRVVTASTTGMEQSRKHSRGVWECKTSADKI